jgi:hypothetical protein
MKQSAKHIVVAISIWGCTVGAMGQTNQVLRQAAFFRTDAMFEILGMIDEYGTRFDFLTGRPMPDLMEAFYPNETNQVRRFTELLVEHAELTGLNTNWTKVTGPAGHVFFSSPEWSKVINSFFVDDRPVIKGNVLQDATKRQKLRFVIGALCRNGYRDRQGGVVINMLNAALRIDQLADVLTSLGCTNVTKHYTPDLIPRSFLVRFVPSDLVSDTVSNAVQAKVVDLLTNQEFRMYKGLDELKSAQLPAGDD